VPDSQFDIASPRTGWQSWLTTQVIFLSHLTSWPRSDVRLRDLFSLQRTHSFKVTVRQLLARAPVRIDFGGGWTDVPPYTTDHGGCVCSVAISRYAGVTLRDREGGVWTDEDGIRHRATSAEELLTTGRKTLASVALARAGLECMELELRSDFPRGAGLGGSSAAGVALQAAFAAWCGERVSPDTLAERSRRTEVEGLGVAGGSQDHYAAAYGGALGLRFTDQVAVERIALPAATRTALEERCTVVYTGESRISAETINGVMDAYRAGDAGVTSALAGMRELAVGMIGALERGDIDQLGALVDEHWRHQRALHPRITTPGIERVLDVARRAGALGGKALGASGGGSVLVIAPEGMGAQVRDAVAAVGNVLDFRVDESGATVEESE
jgi:D-glycero-alpha-D-manno-heptose-7-phosphate kinase